MHCTHDIAVIGGDIEERATSETDASRPGIDRRGKLQVAKDMDDFATRIDTSEARGFSVDQALPQCTTCTAGRDCTVVMHPDIVTTLIGGNRIGQHLCHCIQHLGTPTRISFHLRVPECRTTPTRTTALQFRAPQHTCIDERFQMLTRRVFMQIDRL